MAEHEHPVLAEHPDWQEHLEKVSDVRRRLDAIRLQVLEAERDHVAEAAKFEKEVAEAARTGGVAPENPPQPRQGPARALALIRAEGDRLRAEGPEVLARIAADIEPAVADLAAAELAKVVKAAKALTECRRSLLDALALVWRVRAAAGDGTRPSRSSRTRTSLTFDELIAFALEGGDILALTPLALPESRVQRADQPDQRILERAAGSFRPPTAGLQVIADPVGAFGARPQYRPGWRPLPPGRV